MQQQPPTADTGVTVEALFERHAADLFKYLRQHVPSREDAEDLLLETFLAAIEERKFAQWSESSQVAWLWRVARNKMVSVFRQAAVRRRTSFEQVDEMLAGEQSEELEQQVALHLDEMQQVRELLQRLPPAQQDLLRLRFGYDLRCADIAAILGKREQAVRTMLSRTLQLLRTTYTHR
jgi:RNA polymerase sigma factor (sigma-70 family)